MSPTIPRKDVKKDKDKGGHFEPSTLKRYFFLLKNLNIFRVVPDTDLAGYPAAGYPANNFAGYPAK